MPKQWIYEEGRPIERRFNSEEEARAWFAENDPEGVAFAVEVRNKSPQPSCKDALVRLGRV